MKTAAVVFACVLALAAVASANNQPVPCCPPVLNKVAFGFSYVNQFPAPGQFTGPVNMGSYIDFEAGVAALFIGNYSMNVENYIRRDLNQSYIYMPKYNVCVNATMNDEIFQNRHVCVGAGSDYPNYKASSSLAGTSFSQQIWGSIDGKRYLAVHPKTCFVTAVQQYDIPPAGSLMGTYYNVTTEFNADVFNLPTACTSSGDVMQEFVHQPRKLLEISSTVAAVEKTLSMVPGLHKL